MKLFTEQFLGCCILLSWQMALAGPRLRQRWRLQLRVRIGPDAETAARASGDASTVTSVAQVNVKEKPASLNTVMLPIDNGTLAPTTNRTPTIRASLRRAPPGFVDSPAWDFDSATRLLALLEASAKPLHSALMQRIGTRRQLYSQEYNARRPDGDELKSDAMVEVTNAVAAHLPASRISVKRLKNLLVLRAQYDRHMPTTRGPTFSWKKHLAKRRTTKKFTTRAYAFYRRSQSKELGESDLQRQGVSQTRNQGEDMGDTQNAIVDETLGYKPNDTAVDAGIGDSLNQGEALKSKRDDSEGINALARLSQGAQDEILDDIQNQTEVKDEVLDDNPNQREVYDKQNQEKTDDGPSEKQTQSSSVDKVEDKLNQGEVLDEELSNIPNKAQENKLIHGDAIDKVLYEALMDRHNDGLDKALKLALGNRGHPGEELNKALDKAVSDAQNPSEALDKALHETLGIRENQGDVLDKAIDAALADGTHIDESFKGPSQADPLGEDDLLVGYRRVHNDDNDNNDIDAAQLLNELSINDTNDDVLHKVIAAAITLDAIEHESSTVSTDVNATAEPTNPTLYAADTSVNTTTNESADIKEVMRNYVEDPKIIFYNNSFNYDDGVYV